MQIKRPPIKKQKNRQNRHRRFSTLTNNLKENYRIINNSIVIQDYNYNLICEDLEELVVKILKQYPRLKLVIGEDIIEQDEIEKNIRKTISLMGINLIFYGDLTIRQLVDLQRKLVGFQVTHTVRNGKNIYHCVFNFKEYFRMNLGDEWILQYQTRR